MYVFNLKAEQAFDPKKHMERVLGRVGEGDVTVACWEPGQTSPYHCHPGATEIYFCFEGGGKMRTPTETIEFQRTATHLAVPRALRRRDVRPHQGMAEQPRLEAARRGHRILRDDVPLTRSRRPSCAPRPRSGDRPMAQQQRRRFQILPRSEPTRRPKARRGRPLPPCASCRSRRRRAATGR
jgi:hypothetical protein